MTSQPYVFESKEHLRQRLSTIKERVEWLLINKPSTKGDDRILILTYFQIFEPVYSYNPETQTISFKEPITYDRWRRLTSFESIRRMRQKLQEHNPELQPTDKTIAKREYREEQFRELMVENGAVWEN